MLPSALQVLAFALALLGVLGAALATLCPSWRGLAGGGAGGGVLGAVWQQQGLWADCSWHGTGVFSCSLKPSVLALPAHLQGARVAMVLALLLGVLGLCLATLGLKCTRWGGGRRAKGHTAVAAGVCLVAAGGLCLLAASWVTSDVVARFRDARVPPSAKHEPGGALYLAFVSAGFLLAGGGIFCLSCPGWGTSSASSASSAPTDPSPLPPPQEKEERGGEEKEEKEERGGEEKEEKEERGGEASQQENPPRDTPPPRQQKTQYYSPSKLPAKDVQAGYSLKDYV